MKSGVFRGEMGSSVEKQEEEPYYLIDERTDPKDACKRLREFVQRCKSFPVIGLDTEWTLSVPSREVAEEFESYNGQLLGAAARMAKIRNPVAILQLATRDGPALVIRLRQINALKDNNLDWQAFFIELKDLLSSAEILKVGTAIQTDTSHLFYDYGLYTVSCLDLQHIAFHYNYPKSGLVYLSKRLLNVDMNKYYARTNWDQPSLSPNSLKYAADDAKAAVRIFEKFMEQSIQETKDSPKPIKNCDDYIKLWRYKTDVIYRHFHRQIPSADADPNKTNEESAETPENQQGPSKLLQGCPSTNVDLEYRTYKNTDSKPYPKVPFCVLVLVVILIISLAVSILFQLVQNRVDYSI